MPASPRFMKAPVRSRGWSSLGTCLRATGAEPPAGPAPASPEPGWPEDRGKGRASRTAVTLTPRDCGANRLGPSLRVPGPPRARPSGVGWLEVALLPPSPLPTPDQNAWEQVSDRGKARGCDPHLRTPICSSCLALLPLHDCALFSSSEGTWPPEGRAVGGLNYHSGAPCSVPMGPGAQLKTRCHWVLAVAAPFPEVRGQEARTAWPHSGRSRALSGPRAVLGRLWGWVIRSTINLFFVNYKRVQVGGLIRFGTIWCGN